MPFLPLLSCQLGLGKKWRDNVCFQTIKVNHSLFFAFPQHFIVYQCEHFSYCFLSSLPNRLGGQKLSLTHILIFLVPGTVPGI